MSSDETFLADLAQAVASAGLEVIVIGNTAAILHGVPVMTHDVDLLVRDHPKLREKLRHFATGFGVSLTEPFEPAGSTVRAVGREVHVDFVLSLSSRRSFESIRSRATRVRIGRKAVLVASLEDVIAAKRAAGRPKDLATLPILEQALAAEKALRNGKKNGRRKNAR